MVAQRGLPDETLLSEGDRVWEGLRGVLDPAAPAAFRAPAECHWTFRRRDVACLPLSRVTLPSVVFDIERARRDTPGAARVAHLNNAGAALPPVQVTEA